MYTASPNGDLIGINSKGCLVSLLSSETPCMAGSDLRSHKSVISKTSGQVLLVDDPTLRLTIGVASFTQLSARDSAVTRHPIVFRFFPAPGVVFQGIAS